MTTPEHVVAALQRLSLTPQERDDAAAVLAVLSGDGALFTHPLVGPKLARLLARFGVTATTTPDDVPRLFEQGVAADPRLAEVARVVRAIADDEKRAPALAEQASRKLLGIETSPLIEQPVEGGTKANPLARFTLQVPKKGD